MTANTIVRQHDRIYFLSDAAVYDQDGVIREFRDKVIQVPAVPAAIMTRGPLENTMFLSMAIEAFSESITSLDDLLAGIPELVRISTDRWHRTPVQVTLAGYSTERQRLEAYVMTTNADPYWIGKQAAGQQEIKPYEWIVAPDMMGAPAPSADALTAVGIFKPFTAAQFNPWNHGLAIIEAQRLHRHTQKGHHLVGGYAQLTTITREGVTREVLREWPDRIGHRIDPKQTIGGGVGLYEEIKAQALVNAEARLNRKQRRAMAAAQR